ncbi:IBR domain, a half RING-finger domain-containing protein [Trichoderma breve]|uniref:RBR-type E3 ubiquitin transferase n=1 Tax=Trichoderma breve TaxID=2034170 RepID=A0A9W9E8V7_9HYPO|nr:IBR domain, a half RING-finger domain-containing protein [Trichoderma breve]KAJ4860872.1 IBR domain, a half RING-finger domain-containing protein [Trichoderma breve]
MFRSIKRKTEAALRRRKTNKSIDQITPVDVDWPIQSDSYPPSTSTEDRTATNTTEPEEELTPAEQALQFRFKQDDTSVLHTPALVEEVPAEDSVDEVDVAEQLGLGSYTTKYVPFVETSAMRSNMFVHSANSHYGMVNPAIMGGFGDDDDDSIWLVDDEETEEETEEATTTVKRGEGEDEDEEEDDVEKEGLEEEEEEDEPAVALPPTNQPPPVSTVPEPASTASPDTGFRYRINLALFDDDEFAAPPKETVTVFVDEDGNEDEDDILNPPSPSIDSAELLSAVNEFRRPGSSQDEIAASNGSSTPATSNPYVDLLEQQDSAMTVAYQRRLDLSGRRGDDEADDFSKIWTDIRCPECREFLDYTDIQRYADEETFKRYETLALRAAMAEAENFFWCTSGCGSGQIHESGQDQPIVICLHCTHRSCFHHNVAWHQGLTCDEYDQLLADPDNFRSKLEIDNEAWAAAQEAQLEADRAMAQGLLEEERRVREMREMREREERERTRKAIELARQIAARRKAEEDMSRETVGRTTKPCPGCGWAIEKNDGCSHMTCVKCKHQFCYECGADHKQILEKDNTVHKEDCKFHPSQLEDSAESEVRDNDDDDGDDTEEGDFDEGDFEDEEDEDEEVIVIRGSIRRFK